MRKSSSEASTFSNKRAFSIASADCAAKVLIRSTVFCGKAPGVLAADYQHADDLFPTASSGVTKRARKPARRTISFASEETSSRKIGDLDRLTFQEGGVIFGSSRPICRCVNASINS